MGDRSQKLLTILTSFTRKMSESKQQQIFNKDGHYNAPKSNKETTKDRSSAPVGEVESYPVPPEWREYDKRLDNYLKRLDNFEDDKGTTFVIIMGQCTLMMRNKVEGSDSCDDIEDTNDIVGLLKLIRDLAYATTSIRYSYISWQRNRSNGP